MSVNIWARLAAVLASALLGVSAQASPTVDRMLESIAGTQSLAAEFTQTTMTKSARSRNASGAFAISKPGLLRWEVKKPYPQLQVLNGKEFWMFDPDLAQASVRPIEAANLTGIAALLLNTNSLSRDQLMARYEFTEAGKRDGLEWVRVVPKTPEPGIASLVVGLDPDAMMQRFEIHDNLGQVTRVTLSRVLKNTVLDPKLFQFVPPPGVSVLRAP